MELNVLQNTVTRSSAKHFLLVKQRKEKQGCN